MVTIRDVAEKAGVSISTVSNVLNESKYVSESISAKVRKAVDEMNYVKDFVASNMKRGYTKTVGIITSDICGLFYPYVVRGIYDVLSPRGYSLTIYDSHVKSDEKGINKEKESFGHLFSNKVDGVIFVSSVLQRNEALYLEKLKAESGVLKYTPLVSVERDFSRFGIDSVFYHNFGAAKLAVNHLIDCGCKSIAHIGGPRDEHIPLERKEGYISALKERGKFYYQQRQVVYGDYTHQSGYRCMCTLLESGKAFDGVYAANDQMALGALKSLTQKEIAVPERIKVIGTDDVFTASIVSPSLSTVHIMKTRMGRRAAEILLDRMIEKQPSNGVVADNMEISLVVRNSTDALAVDHTEIANW